MIFSITTLNNIANKLALDIFKLRGEANFQEELLKKTNGLNVYQTEGLLSASDGLSTNTVSYVVTITFSRANVIVTLSHATGEPLITYTSGNFELTGKRKKQRRLALSILLTSLVKSTQFVGRRAVALHLNNVNKGFRRLILTLLEPNYFVRVIKAFSAIPFNGCRKPKLRRKKYTRIVKR